MYYRVDPTSRVGLAEQIAGQVRSAVADGRLRPGERLPAARSLAAGLQVNVHTVLRAYADLRDEGLVDVRRGRGAQVRTDVVPGRLQLAGQISALVESAERLGLTRAELAQQILEGQR